MDLQKMGALLRNLRKEKGLTQEKLAEQFHVSARTVSRWETGSNLPDIDVLVSLADFFSISLRELIDGERKEPNMNNHQNEELLRIAEYSKEREKHLICKVFLCTLIGFAAWIISFLFMAVFKDTAQGVESLLLAEGVVLLVYGAIMLCVKANRTVSGYMTSLIGAFTAIVVSNIGMFVLFFRTGDYYNHGIIALYYCIGIIIISFTAAGVAASILNHKIKRNHDLREEL